jgi:hypothetical protein
MGVIAAVAAAREAPEPLPVFLRRAEDAGGEAEPGAVVDQARTLLEQICVHLPAWRAAGIDPVGRLARLRACLPASRTRLYGELLAIFAELGDRHTRCLLPAPLAGRIAFLPFRVGELFAGGEQRLCVLGSATDEVKRGDLLVSWNGAPVGEEVRRQMALQLGANPEARRARTVQTLTFRPLDLLPPPAGEVVLENLATDGRMRTARLAWQVADASWLARHLSPLSGSEEDGGAPVESLRARRVETSSGTFGHLRVSSFQGRPEAFLETFRQALAAMSPDGLILDVRGCEDGVIPTGEQLLQLLTPGEIEPQRFQFRVTDLVLRLVRTHAALAAWRDAVETAARRSETYSAGRPLTPPEQANRVGQQYRGPVVLVVDALTYSTAEMLAAGFQDHGIGPVLGTARCTGGGGASTWSQATLFTLAGDEAFRPLSGAPVFRVAAQRCTRVRGERGRPVEGVGVAPDVLHLPTRRDLLEEDRDLMERAGRILARMRRGGGARRAVAG